jgi:hypothetical protein
LSLSAFLASLFDLCRFRHGPEDVPYAPWLLVALLVASGVLQVGFNLHDGLKPPLVAGAPFGGLMAIGTVFLLLRGRGMAERFVQTATALVAVNLLFDLPIKLLTLLLPMQALEEYWLSRGAQVPALTGAQTLVMMVVAVLGVWQLCVWIGTLRRALEIPLAGGLLVFLLLVFVNLVAAALVASVIGVA